MYHRQQGYSMVELLVGVLLGSLLMSALCPVYSHLRAAWQRIEAQADFSQRERYIYCYWLSKWAKVDGTNDYLQGYDNPAPEVWARQRLARSSLLVVHHCQNSVCQQRAWFVANARRQDRFGTTIRGLYYKVLGRRRQELVDGVIKMGLRYATMPTGPSVWRPANKISDWHQVRWVEVTLLLRSFYPVANAPKWYWYQGQRFHNATRYWYQSWVMVIPFYPRASLVEKK